jgi:hypothetical protein
VDKMLSVPSCRGAGGCGDRISIISLAGVPTLEKKKLGRPLAAKGTFVANSRPDRPSDFTGDTTPFVDLDLEASKSLA